ncbi:protein yellow [Orussus abietinus]|uniref:protein yellow n=1 Tax=Orussus abietinus TaxID=222816 RepID=UPI000626835B|nr:protein yellow [Orussus abietinus]
MAVSFGRRLRPRNAIHVSDVSVDRDGQHRALVDLDVADRSPDRSSPGSREDLPGTPGAASPEDLQDSLRNRARCEHPSLDEAATKRFPGLLEDERLHRGLSSRPDVGFSEVFFDPPPASNLQRNLIHYPDVGTGNEVQEVTDAEPEVSPGRVHVPGHSYEPPDDRYPKDEYAGPAMDMVFSWTMVDFEYENSSARVAALAEGTYVPENVLPLGLDVWGERVFLTLPKWRDGVPATLATVPRISKTTSPKLRPYPSWEWHRSRTCEGLTSVFRIQVDECARLWVLDSGKVDVADSPFQACPPKILVFDLRTDRLLRKYPLTPDQIKQDSLYSNIAVDVRNGNCEGARAYLADVWRFGIVVYDFSADSSFRVQHRFFFPDPVASRYELHGLGFQWTDGIFGIALSPLDVHSDRTLFFHPMSSFREFAVSTSLLGDKESAEAHPDAFAPVGRPRAKDFGHSSGSAIARNGVMFFNMVTRDSVWCWDTRKEHDPRNLGVVGHSNVSLVFPNDIRVDHEDDQNVWLISNKLPMYLYGRLDLGEPAYRVFRANVRTAVRNTVCDPDYVVSDSDSGYDETC